MSWTSTLLIRRFLLPALTNLLKTDLLVLKFHLNERSLESSDFILLWGLLRSADSTLLFSVCDFDFELLDFLAVDLKDNQRAWLLGLLDFAAGLFLRLAWKPISCDCFSSRSAFTSAGGRRRFEPTFSMLQATPFWTKIEIRKRSAFAKFEPVLLVFASHFD